MNRVIAGVIAANFAAFCLFLLFSGAYAALFEPGSFFQFTHLSIIVASDILRTAALLGLTTVCPLSLLLAIAGRVLGWRSLWIYVVGATAIGVGFASFLNDWVLPHRAEALRLFLLCAAIGPICGWIYGLIAIRRTPEATRAIAKP